MIAEYGLRPRGSRDTLTFGPLDPVGMKGGPVDDEASGPESLWMLPTRARSISATGRVCDFPALRCQRANLLDASPTLTAPRPTVHAAQDPGPDRPPTKDWALLIVSADLAGDLRACVAPLPRVAPSYR